MTDQNRMLAEAGVEARRSTALDMASPAATLKGRDVVALVVGIVIGAGIFRAPVLVAAAAPDEAALVLAWVAGGILSILGALCYAELASAYPDIGGDYHFLVRAYGRRIGFLYGWGRLAVIQTGSIALLAFIFGDYAASLAPAGPYGPVLYAAAAVLLLSAANWLGVRVGAGVQRWLTLLEVGGLVAVICAGLLLATPEPVPRTAAAPGSVGLMMVFVLLTYGGWNEAVYLSAEVRDAPRRMARLMVAGLALVTLLYVLVNIAFLRVLGLGGLAGSEAVATDLMRLAMGDAAAALIGLVVSVAALTSANATALTGARGSCALGRGFVELRWLGRWNRERNTPGNAIVVQAAVVLLLVVAGGFARDGFRLAVEYTAPVFWFFFLLVGIALFVLRRRDPDVDRSYRVPFYPFVPAAFCGTSLYLLYASVSYTGIGALVGIAVLACGALLLPFLKPSGETSA